MRHIGLLIFSSIGLLMAGCASQADHRAPSPDSASVAVAPIGDDDTAATSLVFDPPLTIGEPPVILAREDRQAGAFVGYQEQTVTSFWIEIDDRQAGGNPRCDRYERRAIIVQTGATYR